MKRRSGNPLPSEQVRGLALFDSLRSPLLAPQDARAEALGTRAGEHEEHRARILAVFRTHGTLTADAAGALCGLQPLQCRPRVCELASLDYGRQIRPVGVGRSAWGIVRISSELGWAAALGNPAATYEVNE